MDTTKLIAPALSENATYICETRYGTKDESGKVIESTSDVFWRVASNIAKGDARFGATDTEVEQTALSFYELMALQKFFPNTPCLVNAGKRHQQLSACFVLPIDDTMPSILETMTNMALIHKSGGGTGFAFSRLRPFGDFIASSSGTTVGPNSFMQAYNDVTSQIKQGGVRRGANMGMLSVHHPDVLRFAVVKLDEYSLTNFNISLAVTNKFMDQVPIDKAFVKDESFPEDVVEEIRKAEANRDLDARLREVESWTQKLYEWAKATQDGEGYELINPRNNQVTMKLNAYKVFNLVTRLAWQFGDPGLVFIDRMNEPSSNPIPQVGLIEATNPCGEQPLLPYDACNLGSLNLAKFVDKSNKDLDWVSLKQAVYLAIHFLDNVVEVNEFPVDKIRQMVSSTRRIGLGVMGFADMLFKLGVKYDSEEGITWARKVMKFISDASKEETVRLAVKRGVFPYWNVSVFANTDYKPRNMALTTIAPTGTISMIADCSSGIEPAFSLGYQRNTIEGKKLFMMNPVFMEKLEQLGLKNEELLEKIVKNGGKLAGLEEIPQDVKDIYTTALEISPEWHVRVQAAFQEYVDNAVSKTINFPKNATVEDVRTAYTLSYSLGTKGITIYRSGSREKEVLQQVKEKDKTVDLPKPLKKATPQTAMGIRIRKPCDVGKVYTSVFFEPGDGPVEMFVNLGKSGGYLAGAAEVTGRLASLALKYGAKIDEIAKELVGISCGQKIGFGKDMTLSMFDAVGKSLLELEQGSQLQVGKQDNSFNLSQNVNATSLEESRITSEGKFDLCPDCKSPLYAEEGCYKCSNAFCGYSKCS